MESTSNLHHHQQDQPPTLEPSSSSTITTPSSFHGDGGGTNHSWTPNIILNNAGGNNNPRSRADYLTDNNDMIGVPQRRPLIQDLGYHHQWATASDDAPQSCLTTNKLLIKEEIIDLPKFSCEMLNIPSTIEAYAGLVTTSTTTTTNHMNNHNNNNGDDDLNEKLLLKNLLSGDFYSNTNNNNNNAAQNYYYYPPPPPHIHNSSNFGSGVPSRGGNFSQIYPSINISNNSTALALVSSPMEESLDLLSVSSPPSRSFTTSAAAAAAAAAGLTHQHLATFADNLSFRLDDHMQHHHTIDMSSCTGTSNNASLPNATALAKRPCTSSTSTSMELESSSSSSSLKASHHHQYLQTASKKSRSESRPSSSPPLIKVRKEKLGDRIAALQQLVAPFGKTDTASVLMEAIGYIQFLQSQVETLSVPYMKSSQNQSKRVMQGGSGCRGGDGKDLRSRGLCLVPLSCMSYIAATDNVWQHQPNFGGAT